VGLGGGVPLQPQRLHALGRLHGGGLGGERPAVTCSDLRGGMRSGVRGGLGGGLRIGLGGGEGLGGGLGGGPAHCPLLCEGLGAFGPGGIEGLCGAPCRGSGVLRGRGRHLRGSELAQATQA